MFFKGIFLKKYLYKENIVKIILFLLISSFLIFIDQWTKYLVTLYFSKGNKLVIIENIFEIFYLENRGAAFGILQGQQQLFFIITIIVLLLLFFYLLKIPFKKRYYPLFIVLVLIFSGATGNFIERITKGYVVDFLYFKPINFPLFNVADSYITISCFLLLYLILFYYKEDEIKF